LFCDIRQITDATECLQEEVFVYTNRIAGVVHSICHSYGGSANKNIGDAFLLSWLLDDGPASDPNSRASDDYEDPSPASTDDFSAKNSQADKALLSVVKISIALHHDKYYLEPLSEVARETLLAKLSKRKGPVVQLGFGLHAGKAVQGAIGSQRKIDATYVSEAVERAEFLESSTKKYGVKMLMSDNFHRLLHPSNRRRCREIDRIRVQNEDYAEYQDIDQGDIMELFTFDMDIDALWSPTPKPATKTPVTTAADDNVSETGSQNEQKGSKREILRAQSVRGAGLLKVPALQRRRSVQRIKSGGKKDDASSSEEFLSGDGMSPTEAAAAAVAAVTGVINQRTPDTTEETIFTPPELVLPTGPALYNANVWLSEDMRKIRQLYSDGLFFQKFNSGFRSYYARDWEHAKQCFQTILERFDDGPSTYFLNKIKENNGVPPRDFKGYGSS
jgi:class 3 adenylate cyclase